MNIYVQFWFVLLARCSLGLVDASAGIVETSLNVGDV